MTSYLLTWTATNKPGYWKPKDLHDQVVLPFEKNGEVRTYWRVKSESSRHNIGDTVYLYKQGKGKTGLFGIGTVIQEPHIRSDPPATVERPRVEIKIHILKDPEKEFLLDAEESKKILGESVVFSRFSGVKIHDEKATQLEARLNLSHVTQQPLTQNAKKLIKQCDSEEKLPPKEKEALVKLRVGQGKFRKGVLKEWNSSCAVTGCADESLLIASHILPWQQCDEKQCIDPMNGLLLTPNLDRLFDRHLITFEKDGRIRISARLSPKMHQLLGIHKDMKLRHITVRHNDFLEMHRQDFIG